MDDTEKRLINKRTVVLTWDLVKSSQIYLYSAFHNTDCIKAAPQYQSKQLNSVCLLLEKGHPSLVEQMNGMMGHLT